MGESTLRSDCNDGGKTNMASTLTRLRYRYLGRGSWPHLLTPVILLIIIYLVYRWISSPNKCQDIWVTTGDEALLLQHESICGQGSAGNGPVFEVYVDERDQFIKGFGAAISNAAAHNMYNEAADRQSLLNDLFNPSSGIGISYIRLVMGASDFNAVEPYTYDDMPSGQDDFQMEQFSIEKDLDFVIPVIKEILAINPGIRILASPWSPPVWMKNPESLNGGSLKQGDQYKEALAEYFVHFVQDYAAEGIQIDSITIQNEPDYATNGYPTMRMTWQEQRDIINYLGPKFQSAGITTEIIIWDHNWDNTGYSMNILDDSEANQYVSGSGWHCYGGDGSSPTEVREAHPDKDLHFTECSGGGWTDTDFASNFIWNLETLFIGQTRIGARTVLLWNMALDEQHGPRVGVSGGCSDCRGVVTVNTASGDYQRELEYYAIGHFSKFVKPGAQRVELSSVNQDWVDVGAYVNIDDSVAVVVLNTNLSEEREFNILVDGTYYNYSLPPRSAATLVV